MRILLVEDGENWCRAFKNTFRKPQYVLKITDDIDEAENLIRQTDIAVVNISLIPGMDWDESGKVFLAYIQDHYSHIPRIAISGKGGYSVREITEEFIEELGVYDVLIKPFKIDKLVKEMNDAVNKGSHDDGNSSESPPMQTMMEQNVRPVNDLKKRGNIEMNDEPQKIEVFISYATEDYNIAKRLYDDLGHEGAEPWLDRENLLPGQNWRETIPRIIRDSSYFLLLISKNSVSKRGYVQKEQKIALDVLDEFSPDKIFIIPARIDNTEPVDEKLRDIHWADFSDYEKGLDQILRTLKAGNPNLMKEDSVMNEYKDDYALKNSASPPFATSRTKTTFSISCKPEHRLNIRVSGEVSYNNISEGILRLDTDVYARHADNTYRFNDWRFQSKETGKQLFQKIFVEHPETFSTYNHARGAVTNEEEFHFRFEADRKFLRVPLEFLYADGEYLILQYPTARSNNSVRIKKKALSPSFFNDIWSKNKTLKILLIASNTSPSIPGVDQEISSLEASVKAMFENIGISVRLKTIPTHEATYEAVRKELKNCSYHIIHYAGHGSYDLQSPERSPLFFWEKPNRKGEVKKMPVSEFKMLLRGSDVRFVYLSCCLGAATGDSAKLLDDDFLGITDGLVQAGVPSVLGFRWPVSDRGAIMLSNEFYQSLAKQGQIDTALFEARYEVATRDRDDITWISPILIMQSD